MLIAPSNPVVSIAPILAVPGLREAVTGAQARVVGVSPIIGGAPVRGMADKCLAVIDVPCDAAERGRGSTGLAVTAACWTAGWWIAWTAAPRFPA